MTKDLKRPRFLLLVLGALLALSGCQGTLNMPPPTGPDVDALAEADEHRGLDPSSGWESVAPGVWYLERPADGGGTVVSYWAEGDEGFIWMFENQIVPLRNGVAPDGRHQYDARLQQELARFYDQIYEFSRERYDSLMRGEAALAQTVNTSAICVSFVKATAGPTTAQPGAKATARAKNCFDHSYVGVLTWPTSSPDGWFYKTTSYEGQQISLSKSVYAVDAMAHGYADNGLAIASDWWPPR